MSLFLVTGGAGFIGRCLSRELLRNGHQVRVLDCLVEQAHGCPPEERFDTNIDFRFGDVRDRALVAEALKGVDGVFHLAAEVGVGQSMYEVARYVSGNDLATAVLLEEIGRANVARVVVASSMSVYGEGLYRTPDGTLVAQASRTPARLRAGEWEPAGPSGEDLVPVPTPETKRPDLTSVYALSKYVQERLTLMLCAAYGIEAVALRLFNVFGPGQALSNPYTGVLAIFAGRLLRGERPLVYEDGLQRRDFVHVRDVARAFRLAMETPEIDGEVLNVASGRSRTVLDIAELLAAAMDCPELGPEILRKSRAGDIRHCIADTTRAEQVLGFRPAAQLEDTVHELVEWVSQQEPPRHVPHAQYELERRGLVT